MCTHKATPSHRPARWGHAHSVPPAAAWPCTSPRRLGPHSYNHRLLRARITKKWYRPKRQVCPVLPQVAPAWLPSTLPNPLRVTVKALLALHVSDFPPLAFRKQVGLTWSTTCSLTPGHGVFSGFHGVNTGVQRHAEPATAYSPSSSTCPPCPRHVHRAPGTDNVRLALFASLSSPFSPPSASGPRPFLEFLQCGPFLTPVSGAPSVNLSGPGHLPAP